MPAEPQSISGENGVAFNALGLCFHVIPDAKPLRTFAGIAQSLLDWQADRVGRSYSAAIWPASSRFFISL
ncbi:hypothetical protein DMY87_20780 [Rhizobium wuzhouense]|uniref:Transposase n=1 Tax=Rhizobium wuzhouense TaxID=1986026 RepID=A0ABX5NPA4_9HYPH|nr:hypothetical protein DMY87_20780 [Rhizobium wuzhouense]